MKKRKRSLRLKLLCFIWLLGMADVHAVALSQPVRVRFKNATLHEVIWELEKQTAFNFIYNTDEVKAVKVSNIVADNIEALDVLRQACAHSGLIFEEHDGVVVIKPEPAKENDSAAQLQQNVTIQGRIVDATGNPVAGAYISLEGARTGTAADVNGVYTITAPANGKLLFSAIGYKTQIMDIAGRTAIDITMEDDAMVLSEVVVTGYGTYTKAAYAGSASVIKTEVLTDVPMPSVNTMLQGMAAGVTSTLGTSGQPGATQTIRIRGTGSYSASNTPLYVIDGVPVTSGDIGSLGTAGTDIMSTINPSDIENISIIKDAAAASLYGSRAANGVIIITTKRGKAGKAQFNFKADAGFSEFATPFRPYLDGDERREFLYDAMVRQYEYRRSDPNVTRYATATAYADAYINSVAPIPWSGWADWWDALFRRGSYRNYELTASGAAENFNYFSSLSVREQEGIQRIQSMNTVQGRINVEYKANRRVELGARIMFSTVTQDVGYDGMEYNSPLYGVLHKITASDPIYNQDGTYNRSLLSNGKYNPVAVLDHDISRQYVTRSFNIVYGTYSITEKVKFTSRFGYDYVVTKAKDWASPEGSSDWVTAGSQAGRLQERQRTTWQNQLSYIKTFKGKHNVDALLGYETDRSFSDYVSATSRGFINADKHEISSGAVNYATGGSSSEYRMVSYLAKANYNYNHTYYLGASYRIDGTSRLRPENRWGHFWSLSGSWRFVDENITKRFNQIITDGKLRLSYGVNGTQPSSNYAGYNTYGYGYDYYHKSGQIEGSIVSDKLVWESNYNLNFGIDIEVIRRISATMELYDRTTKDLIFASPVSRTTGTSSVTTNIGSFRNRGVEFELYSQNITGKDVQWTTSFNISRNWNKVIKLNGESDEIINGRHIIKEGYDYYTTYLVEFCDINPENGNARFYKNTKDANGNIDLSLTERFADATRKMGVITTPKYVGGLTNIFRYKWMDIALTVSYTLGGYSFDNAAQKSREAGTASASAINQIPVYYREAWKKPGDVAKYEGWFYKNNNNSMVNANTGHLHSTDHLRLKSFTLGATLPKNWSAKAGVTKARAYISGMNMLTWAKWNQYDPEVPYDGIMGYNTPVLKTLTFGIEIGF